MAAGDAGQNGAGQSGFTPHTFAGGDRGETAGGRHAQGKHGLRDKILPQYGSQWCAAITAAGIGCGSATLKLQVKPSALAVKQFTE